VQFARRRAAACSLHDTVALVKPRRKACAGPCPRRISDLGNAASGTAASGTGFAEQDRRRLPRPARDGERRRRIDSSGRGPAAARVPSLRRRDALGAVFRPRHGRRDARRHAAAISTKATTMLKLALILFVVSLIAAALGFTGVAGAAAGLAKIIFIIAIALFLIVLVLALLGIQLFT
jgi:uncharacterized membrane protein YtjA (UPF0391 family)